ncbi:MAG TPA: HAD family hydrolase [Thermoplasmata archaeon]|nr:HAD family hydrolase [Thermoplasmata archaeon]
MVRSPSNDPRVVFFDMDDTIFDHSLTCRAALAVVRRREPRFASLSLDRLWRRYLDHLSVTDLTLGSVGHPPSLYAEARAARFRALARDAGWECTVAESRDLSTLYRRAYTRLRRAVPGAVPLVRRVARSRPVGIVTNNQVAEQEEKLAFLGLTRTVDYLIISEAVGAEKPSREIFRAALKAARVRPHEAVMVGDSWRNDVLGARGAGIRPVWFNRFGHPRPTRHRVAEVTSFQPTPKVERVLGLGKSRPASPPR